MPLKLGELYHMAIELAMERDPRSREVLTFELRKMEERFRRLDQREKERFDKDALWNPYADSRLLYGDPDRDVNGVLWGIDITSGEIVLADRLREKGRTVDAVIGHHPRGMAEAYFSDVMHVMENMMEDVGVPITVAEDIMAPRIREVHLARAGSNFDQTVDAARLLDIPFMCLHAATDILVQRFMEDLMETKRPQRLGDIMDLLYSIPEMEQAARLHNPPEICAGNKDRHAGKIMVKMCGGTVGPKDMYEKLAQAGVGTFICMHLPDSHIEEAKKHHVNVIISGHMASDSLGINLLADQVEARGVQIIPCSGFIRVKRT